LNFRFQHLENVNQAFKDENTQFSHRTSRARGQLRFLQAQHTRVLTRLEALESRPVNDTTSVNELQLSVDHFRTENETFRNENRIITTERDQLRHSNTRTTEARNRLQSDYNSLQATNVAVIVERDRLRESIARYRARMVNTENHIANLYLNFPTIADMLLSTPHQIDPDVVLTKDGRPNMRYTTGKMFRAFHTESSFVVYNERRVCIMITTVSE
jgi:chromosome segregation ATPase